MCVIASIRLSHCIANHGHKAQSSIRKIGEGVAKLSDEEATVRLQYNLPANRHTHVMVYVSSDIRIGLAHQDHRAQVSRIVLMCDIFEMLSRFFSLTFFGAAHGRPLGCNSHYAKCATSGTASFFFIPFSS